LYGVGFTLPGCTKGDTTTAPMRPPPGPGTRPPGLCELGPGRSPQQADESPAPALDSASSNVTTSSPSRPNAGEARIFGIHSASHASALASPPGRPSTHGASWPSLHRLGTITDRFAVLWTCARSPGRRDSGTSLRAHDGESMIDWK
jgi:hypothetical protein